MFANLIIFAALGANPLQDAGVESPYDFRKRLETVHEPGRRDPQAVPSPDEFVFSDGAVVALPGDADEVLTTAAEDFVDYLKVSMSVKAAVGRGRAEAALSVTTDKSMPERSCRIDAGERVRITAADSRAAAQALYHLEDMMNLRCAPFLKKGSRTRRALFSPRMTHSGWGLDVFPDAHLAQIAHAGMDAIVIFITGVDRTRGVPRQNVADIIRRAKRRGLDTYLYCKFPPSEHPDTPEAKKSFDETYGRVAAAYPEAKGFVFVGESCQFPTKDERAHIVPWKKNRNDMRRTSGWWPCRDWPDWLKAVRSAVDSRGGKQEIVFWTYNWGRCPVGPRLDLIGALPADITLMATFEMFEPQVKRNGLRAPSADYSLSFEGPGRYFSSEAKAACGRGIKLYSMSNTGGLTWDYGTIPYQPCPYQWKRRYDNIVKAGRDWKLSGLMECHHYGWHPSFISELEKEAFTEGGIPFDEHIRMIAERDYGRENVGRVLEAWKLWSDAARDFVASNVNQYGPFRIGPAYPYNYGGRHIKNTEFPISKNATNKNITRYNYLDRDSYSPEGGEVGPLDCASLKKELELLEEMRTSLGTGAGIFEEIAAGAGGRRRAVAKRMARLGRFMQRTVITAINVKNGAVAHRAGDREKVFEWARREYANAKAALPLVEADSRLGWEPTMEYAGGPEQIRWKLKRMVETYSGAVTGGCDRITMRDPGGRYDYSFDRGSCLYRCGETARLKVCALEKDGSKSVSGKVSVVVDDWDRRVFYRRTVDLAAENPFEVGAALDVPGFLRFRFMREGAARDGLWSVGYEPEKIRTAVGEPEDFDRFWKDAVDTLERSVPLDPVVTPMPERSGPGWDFYRVSFASYGRRVHGFMSVPKDRTKWPCRVRVELPSAGRGMYAVNCKRSDDEVHMMITIYPFAPPVEEKALFAAHDRMVGEIRRKYGCAGYSGGGIGVSREEYFYYPVILGANRAVNWLAKQPFADRKRFTYTGGSQGGGLGLGLCALNPIFAKVVLHVPAYCDAYSYTGRRSGAFTLVNRMGRGEQEKAKARLSYFDGAYFARRIKCPTRVSVAFLDRDCPPATVYAAYNNLAAEDVRISHMIGFPHGIRADVLQQLEKWRKDLR